MGDGRRCRSVAVYASVGVGVYGEDMGDRGFGAGMVESRGVCRIKEIWGEGKERKRVVVWRNHRILVWNCAGGCDRMKEGENIFKSAKA